MKFTTLFHRRKGTPKPITVESSYEEIRLARESGQITTAYAFGIIQEKNRRDQARNRSA